MPDHEKQITTVLACGVINDSQMQLMYSEILFTVRGYRLPFQYRNYIGSAVWQLINRRERSEVAKQRMGYTLDDVTVSHSQSTDVYSTTALMLRCDQFWHNKIRSISDACSRE